LEGIMWNVGNVVSWFLERYRVRILLRAVGRCGEVIRYSLVRAQTMHRFLIVSTQRNAGRDVIRCLDSVDRQRYPKDRYRHLVIDDASTDDTAKLIENWCEGHPSHNVELIRRPQRLGGTHNTLEAIRQGDGETIVVELNGDDRLPDPGVLAFLNKVYQDPDVWMTYNTQLESTGVIPFQLPPPRSVRRDRSYRDFRWATSHLHSFRRPLFDHVPEEVMIDPESGEFWKSADDVALYLYMLELAGDHAVHIWRITCVYNFHAETEYRLDRKGQLDRQARIRAGHRAEALDSL
jgi:glycosyltransferase involved in cell wall biosynthesis